MIRRVLLALLCMAMLTAPILSAALFSRHTAIPTDATRAHTVYLTFDDGPSLVTEQVLNILREEQVQATFFVIGATTDRGISLYNRILEEGHSLGLHTYSHDANRIYASLDSYTRDFMQLEQWIHETTGTTPRVCRMVGGSNSSYCPAILREQILTMLIEESYACYDWDIDAMDSFGTAITAGHLVENVVQAAQKKTGQDLIILLHDDALRNTLPAALPEIIAYFRAQGYGFAALWDDTESVKRILPQQYQS